MASTKTTLLMVNDYPNYIDSEIWSRELSKRVPELQFRLWPHQGNPADVDIVLIDKGAPPGLFEGMTRLRALVFLGAGIDGLRLSELPPAWALCASRRESLRLRWCSTCCFGFSTNNDMPPSMQPSNKDENGVPSRP
jgi:hypothetical protein